jgi:hypothetical protein
MNAAAEVLRLKHWPPRGVYTRWRPRKRFCSGIVCIPPTSERNLAASRFGVCSKLDIVRVISKFSSSIRPGSWRKSKEMKRFQNGILTAQDADNGCLAPRGRCRLRASLRLARPQRALRDCSFKSLPSGRRTRNDYLANTLSSGDLYDSL